ncbi:MAG: hypothetical protein PF692_07490 [Kiritimatiellae bacterium]|jgi:autotransporter-associated beta strand protein|nr:hypothetical protein [Kiritimatiellia bacterium]
MKRKLTILIELCLISLLNAQTIMDVDINDNPGILAGLGGRWDFNNTVLWSSDDGTNRVAWLANSDIVRIQQDTAYNWGDINMNVTNENGQVGAAGIVITGNLISWKNCNFKYEAFELGAEGLQYLASNSDSFLYFESPIILTDSQIWESSCIRNMDGGGNVVLNNTISSKSGTTDLTFSGMNITDPGKTSTADLRVGFYVQGQNSFNGSTTVKDGASLSLAMSVADEYPLNPTKPLILNGGYIRILSKGSLNVATQEFSNVVIDKGYNRFSGRNAGIPIFVCNDITQTEAGTVDFPVSWAGASAYTTTTNVTGIIGGWATHNRSAFAYAGNDGSSTLISGLAGTQRNRPSDWGNNENIIAYAGDTPLDEDVAINSLRITTSDVQDLATYTVTINSGGIIAGNATANTLVNGTIKTGLASGELFIHAFDPCFINSVIADNGNTPCILVLSGDNTITLTKANTFTGKTYLNAGILVLTNEAFVANEVVQAGGTTLDVRNEGTIKPGDNNLGAITLNGNLTLEDGANLEFDLGETSNDALHLANPYATFTGASSAGGITLTLSKNGGVSKQVYTLIDWNEDATLTSLDLSDFTLSAPTGIIGTLSLNANSLDYEVTSTGFGTILIVK